MALTEKYGELIQKTFAKYPDKRSAVMPMLHLAQQEYGDRKSTRLNSSH